MRLGAHQSVAGGVHNAIKLALADECEAVQLFVKSPNRWSAPALQQDEIEKFISIGAEFGCENITAHAAYLINLASPKDDVAEKSIVCLTDELLRCNTLKIPFHVLHPGSHLDTGFDAGVERIIAGIDEIYGSNDISTMLLLEITAGMGSSIGGKFEHLEAIIESTTNGDKLGVCLDTCHLYASGYDLVNDYEKVIGEAHARFGDKLKVCHLNDSKGGVGEHKDRHELLGKGSIGLETFKMLVNDSRLQGVLGILETPNERYIDEIRLLKSLRG
ncbi:MAG: deoxyribonuclease IV [Deferribacteraceae bacterium]|jgi:deoxyribonuclease-4|nr:deoxyribonuclease IV [Deferribacteraceae bacterium]